MRVYGRSRLHYLRELPKGKTAGHFQSTDISKLKGNRRRCVVNLRLFSLVSLLQVGLVETVREQTEKKYCEILGQGGGFIMAANSSMDECDPGLVKVWVDATREYGVDVGFGCNAGVCRRSPEFFITI